MTLPRTGSELSGLVRLAQELAREKDEAVHTGHLLAALADHPSATADLLSERKLFAELVLERGAGRRDDEAELVKSAVLRARELAQRLNADVASSAHLLVALLGEPRALARALIEQAGVDVARLRAAALHVAQGLRVRRRDIEPVVTTRRAAQARSAAKPATAAVSLAKSATSPVPPPSSKKSRAEVVPLMSIKTELAKKSRPAAASQAAPNEPARAVSERFRLDPQKYPTLSALGRNLSEAAAKGELDPVVGRESEIENTLDVLAKLSGNNPCLVGPAGVGKSSVVLGVAARIARTEGENGLDDRILVEIPIGELLSGTGVRGALAARFSALKKEVAAGRGRIVLFFDEIHQLFSGEATDEIAGELKLALSRGLLPCIGATTRADFARTIEADPALNRRFSPVEIEEPSRAEAFLILDALSPRLAGHHQVTYEEQALALSVGWSARYLVGKALPDKAISILDLAGARARRRARPVVDPAGVAEVVAELAQIPIERLLESDTERMLRLEELLRERIVGHEAEIVRIANILRRNAAGLGARRPIGTFLLLGPTGVGKTETAKAVAEVLFDNENAMTRLDMSEFSEAHTVARLIGAPPGYVGHEAGGQLTEAVRRRPYQVLLLDEIEKAHPEVLTAFLGLFDEGRLTDGRGRTVDFTNTAIFMTSNLGAEASGSAVKRSLGFGQGASSDSGALERRVVAAARTALAPELYNRIDEVLVFAPLSREQVRAIAERLIAALAARLAVERGVRLELDPAAFDFLLDQGGYDSSLGARPMRRTIARALEVPLADKLLRGELVNGDVVLVDVQDDAFSFDVLEKEQSAAS